MSLKTLPSDFPRRQSLSCQKPDDKCQGRTLQKGREIEVIRGVYPDRMKMETSEKQN